MGGFGWDGRLQILRREAEETFLAPLQRHGWTAKIARVVDRGEYIVIEAVRLGHRHAIAFMYTSGAGKEVFAKLEADVEHVFIHGSPFDRSDYTVAGIKMPVTAANEFHGLLMAWNASSSPGKLAPSADEVVIEPAAPADYLLLHSEVPIDAVWLRLRQLQSKTLAEKLVRGRFVSAGTLLDDEVVKTKAEGLAYALRNAADYYRLGAERTVSQRVLNLYYGTMAFASAEMLALPTGPATLAEVEDSTKFGHGLGTLDGAADDLEHIVVFPLPSGFFPGWLRSMGLKLKNFPATKPKAYADLQADSPWITVEQLFARIPEVGDLFRDIFTSTPGWVEPSIDQDAAPPFALTRSPRASRTYIVLTDESARLKAEELAQLPGPLSEIVETKSGDPGRHFQAAVDHPGKEHWGQALKIHHSPLARSGSMIFPIFGVVDDYRVIATVLLYALSIIVRYRPSLWRRVQEGDLDHMRALVEGFLSAVERILPQQFLERITGLKVHAKTPGLF